MPIKDKEKLREYKRLWIAKKRKGFDNVEPKEVFVEPLKNVEPTSVEPLNVEPVEPKSQVVEPETMPNLVKPTEDNSVKPCSKCLELNKENDRRLLALSKDKERLQWEVDNCLKRHTIPKEAEFVDLMWDRRYKKFIFYGCADPCWQGSYCNKCSSLEQQLINKIKEKQNK